MFRANAVALVEHLDPLHMHEIVERLPGLPEYFDRITNFLVPSANPVSGSMIFKYDRRACPQTPIAVSPLLKTTVHLGFKTG